MTHLECAYFTTPWIGDAFALMPIGLSLKMFSIVRKTE